MNFSFKVNVGDTSGDGHEMTKYIYFKTNCSEIQLDKLHRKMESVFCVDFDDVCSDYEDNLVPHCLLAKMKELGCYDTDLFSDAAIDTIVNGSQGDHYLDCDAFVELQLALMKHIDPNLEYEIIKDPTPSWGTASGGYGLLGIC